MRAIVESRAGSAEHLDIYGQSWAGRRVAVVGLGKSGMAAARLLCRVGADVRVTDLSDTPELRERCEVLKQQGVLQAELGAHSRRIVEQSEWVILSPGIRDDIPLIRWAHDEGLSILSEVELAYRFCRAPIVAVTGTNGKSTAVTLITEVLRAGHVEAVSCGNIGIPFSAVVGQLTPDHVAVVEVSSFQLLNCYRFRPHIAVLLNLGSNHLDRHGDIETYHQAKERLFRRQRSADWAVLNANDERVVALSDRIRSQCVWFGANRTNSGPYQLSEVSLAHLSEPAQVALQVGRLVDIPDPLSWQVIRQFKALEHRLEEVAYVQGTRFINDAKSTTPESTLHALDSTAGEVVLILGGRDKGLDEQPLLRAIAERPVKGVVLLGEVSQRWTPQMRALVNGNGLQVQQAANLTEAVENAWKLAGCGGTVLFSPACASFDMFKSFEDRGRSFKQCVHALSPEVTMVPHPSRLWNRTTVNGQT